MPNSSKWLTDTAWEKRIRRALNKYGFQLHKSRKRNGGYTVVINEDVTEWYPNLNKLQACVEYWRCRYSD